MEAYYLRLLWPGVLLAMLAFPLKDFGWLCFRQRGVPLLPVPKTLEGRRPHLGRAGVAVHVTGNCILVVGVLLMFVGVVTWLFSPAEIQP